MVTEGVVHGVHKLVTGLSSSVTWRHKVSGSKCHCVTRSQTYLKWYLKDRDILPNVDYRGGILPVV